MADIEDFDVSQIEVDTSNFVTKDELETGGYISNTQPSDYDQYYSLEVLEGKLQIRFNSESLSDVASVSYYKGDSTDIINEINTVYTDGEKFVPGPAYNENDMEFLENYYDFNYKLHETSETISILIRFMESENPLKVYKNNISFSTPLFSSYKHTHTSTDISDRMTEFYPENLSQYLASNNLMTFKAVYLYNNKQFVSLAHFDELYNNLLERVCDLELKVKALESK